MEAVCWKKPTGPRASDRFSARLILVVGRSKALQTMFTRLLFLLTLLLALTLGGVVLVAPWLAPGESLPLTWERLLDLFAWDVAVRRTTVGCAVGLAATACIFFRLPRPRKAKESAPPRAGPAVGA